MSIEPSQNHFDSAEQADQRWAVTEAGKRLQYTERDVENALKVLVFHGGSHHKAAAFLAEQGAPIPPETLRYWRDRGFARLYLRLRKELGREVGEEIAGRAMERALQADDAEKRYIEAASAKVDEVSPNHLAKNALALASAKGQNIEKAQLLRHEPTQIVETRDLGDLVGVLERLKVVEKPAAIEGQAVEVEPVT